MSATTASSLALVSCGEKNIKKPDSYSSPFPHPKGHWHSLLHYGASTGEGVCEKARSGRIANSRRWQNQKKALCFSIILYCNLMWIMGSAVGSWPRS